MATQLNGSVSKAFAVLRLVTDSRTELAAADLVRELGMNGITAHRFLRTLEQEGALVQSARGRFRLGYLLSDLGDRVAGGDALGHILQPILQSVTADLQEASMATIYQTGMVVCIARAVSRRTLSVDIRVGHRLEAYCTAHGKLWLAHLPDRELTRYLDQVELRPLTQQTVTSRDALRRELATAREAGYAVNQGEREEGISAVAVPVVSATGRMIVGLSAFGPSMRLGQEFADRARDRLDQAAAEVLDALYGKR